MKKTILIIIASAICTVLFYGMRYLNTPLSTVDAKLVVYEQSVKSKALFVRDEDVYVSDMNGTVYNHYAEGARVKSGALLSTVYSGNVSNETMQELRTIDKKINTISETGGYGAIYDVSSISAESIINDYKERIIDAGESCDMASISTYKEVINGIRSGNASQTAEGMITKLLEQKMMVENRIGVAKSEIFSHGAGIFTTVLDGLENYLTPEFARNMTVSDFEAVRVNSSEAIGATVNEGSTVCKVANNHEWFVLVCIDAEKAEDYDIGTRVQMRFSNIPGEQIECKILNKSPEENGKVLVLLVSNYYLEGVYSFRESEATVILKSYTGYKVPVYALRTVDNVKGILAEKNNVQKFYPCEVLYTDKDEEFMIVNSVKDGESLNGIERVIVGER